MRVLSFMDYVLVKGQSTVPNVMKQLWSGMVKQAQDSRKKYTSTTHLSSKTSIHLKLTS
jgi:hypothetical protein